MPKHPLTQDAESMETTIRREAADLFLHHNERWPEQPIDAIKLCRFLALCSDDEIKALYSAMVGLYSLMAEGK